MDAKMKAVIVEVTFRTVVAVPDEVEDALIETIAVGVARDNLADIMLEAYQVKPLPRPAIKMVGHAKTADEVLTVFQLSDNDDPYLFAPGGYNEPALSEVFPEEIE